MASQSPSPWQTAGRQRNSHSASRTPQTKSGTSTPIQQQSQSSHPGRQEGARTQQQQPSKNVWAQNIRSNSASSSNSNGAARQGQANHEEGHKPSTYAFNAEEVKAFLSRDVKAADAYEISEAVGVNKSSSAWGGSKPQNMANNQSFFVQLARQVTAAEGTEGG